jgi:hypothetical protein
VEAGLAALHGDPAAAQIVLQRLDERGGGAREELGEARGEGPAGLGEGAAGLRACLPGPAKLAGEGEPAERRAFEDGAAAQGGSAPGLEEQVAGQVGHELVGGRERPVALDRRQVVERQRVLVDPAHDAEAGLAEPERGVRVLLPEPAGDDLAALQVPLAAPASAPGELEDAAGGERLSSRRMEVGPCLGASARRVRMIGSTASTCASPTSARATESSSARRRRRGSSRPSRQRRGERRPAVDVEGALREADLDRVRRGEGRIVRRVPVGEEVEGLVGGPDPAAPGLGRVRS